MGKSATTNEVVNGQAIVEVKYAGFWSRSFALIIDGIIVAIFFIAIGLAASVLPAIGMGDIFQWDKYQDPASWPRAMWLMLLLAVLATVLMAVAYEPFFVGRYGRTPGRKAMGIRVIRADGGRVGYGRSVMRALCKAVLYNLPVVGVPLALISVGLVVFRSRKQSLHDLVCRTVTIKNIGQVY